MTEREPRIELSAAVYRGDAEALMRQLTREPWPDDALQVIGDGLLLALTAGLPGAAGLASRCVEELDERYWIGDRELATALRAALGEDVIGARELKPLPVELDELSGALEGDYAYSGGRIDLHTGEVWGESAIEYGIEIGEIEDEDEDDADPDRWLHIDSHGSREGYRDMELFIEGLDDPDIADRLGIAINGRGAFRRFKDVLSRWPELQERWYSFTNERAYGRARAWLADEGYTPAPRSRTAPGDG